VVRRPDINDLVTAIKLYLYLRSLIANNVQSKKRPICSHFVALVQVIDISVARGGRHWHNLGMMHLDEINDSL